MTNHTTEAEASAAAAADQTVEILGNNGKSTLIRVCISTGLLSFLLVMVLLLVDVLGQPSADSVMMTAGQLAAKAGKRTCGGGGCLWPLNTPLCRKTDSTQFISFGDCPTEDAERKAVGVFSLKTTGPFPIINQIEMDLNGFVDPSEFTGSFNFLIGAITSRRVTLLASGEVVVSDQDPGDTYSATNCCC